MSRVIDVEGKTIDEAIFAGLEQLGLAFDEVSIDILQESSNGFLGIGRTNAKVRLTEREKEDLWADEKPAAKTAEPVIKQSNAQTKPQQNNRSEKRVGNSRPPKKAHNNHQRKTDYPVAPRQITGEPVSADEPSMVFLAGLLSAMGIQGSLQAVRNENGLHVMISGDGMGQIIGYRGETLDAMQFLTSLIENKDKDGYTRVTLDTENYRAKREQTLSRLAKRYADKAIRSNSKVALEPMNPYERRIIHSSLQNYRGVTTVSEGEEPNRKVIIVPDKK